MAATVKQRKQGGKSSKPQERELTEQEIAVDATKDVIQAVAAHVWQDWQIIWYRGVLRKTLLVGTVLTGILLYAVLRQEDHPELPPFDPSETWRVALTGVGAAFSIITVYYDLYHATPPEQDDVKRHLLGKNNCGHFSYLTFWILFAMLVYWNTSFIAELVWLWGIAHDKEMAFARKLIKFTYGAAPLVGALGPTLTILFLKFNWFEPRWRKEVLELYESRGHTSFKHHVLFTHLNQTPLSFLDVTVIKNRTLLLTHTPEFYVFATFIVCWGIFYVFNTHMNHRLSGNRYPYPFLHTVLKTWSSEIMFISAIIIFVNLMTGMMYFLATLNLAIAEAESMMGDK